MSQIQDNLVADNAKYSKVSDYKQLTKFTLSFTVVFSCLVCYILAPNVTLNSLDTIIKVLELFVAGMLVTGSANAINQALEKDTDSLMKRTSTRPIASGRMSVNEAYTFAAIAGFVGCAMMWYWFNLPSALLSAASLFLYGFIYTPLKKVNSVAVFVGGFPGAIPCLIGWVAAVDCFSPFDTITLYNGTHISNWAGWALFLIQFLWQFPHFWAIAWVAHTDYTKAGFKLLPADKGPTKFTAIQTIMYSVLLIPVCFLPVYLGITQSLANIFLLACNVFMIIQCLRLYKDMSVKAARRVMFSSYIYLPLVQMLLIAFKKHY